MLQKCSHLAQDYMILSPNHKKNHKINKGLLLLAEFLVVL
jgi:hypothetical protein